MKVHLDKRPLSNDRSSLRLVITHNGKRHYENLNLHISNHPKTTGERQAKKEALKLAESIRAKRLLSIQNQNYGFVPEFKKHTDFLEYFKTLANERKSSDGNYANWDSSYKHLTKFSNGQLTFADIDEHYISRFKEYLLKAVSQNSASTYFNKFRTTLRTAFEHKIINDNPAKRVRGIKQEDTKREFLEEEEIQLLMDTDCEFPMLKKAFIFSCLTGLRWSDCIALQWSNFHYSKKDGWKINFRQVKTKGQEYLPISEQTKEWLGKHGVLDEKVFKGMKYSAWHNLKLAQWVMKAGITKKITFHCARHTHATLLLSNNTDIYTVMSILGHRNVRTTQIYAKVMDHKKVAAVNNVPKFKL